MFSILWKGHAFLFYESRKSRKEGKGSWSHGEDAGKYKFTLVSRELIAT